jgi:hypothetical protein
VGRDDEVVEPLNAEHLRSPSSLTADEQDRVVGPDRGVAGETAVENVTEPGMRWNGLSVSPLSYQTSVVPKPSSQILSSVAIIVSRSSGRFSAVKKLSAGTLVGSLSSE